MDTAAPVMVGVDGSKASLRAALWAADEAAARDTTLHLLYVVDPERVGDLDDAMAVARHALHRVWRAVTNSDKHVKLESEILQGNPVIELTNAARRAVLICVGHKGIKDSAPMARGWTASSLVRMAPTSVAVVRRQHTHPRSSFHRWIVTVVDESAQSHAVLQMALDEAALREAPVLALTTWSTTADNQSDAPRAAGDIRAKMNQYLKDSRDDAADVQVCALRMPSDVTTLLEQSSSIDQLLVVDAARHDVVDQLTGEGARRALRGTNCSILVVRTESPVSEESSDESADAR